MTVRFSRLLCAAALCIGTVSAAQADPVFTNLGADQGYVGSAWVISGDDTFFGHSAIAMTFTSGGNYDINEIDTYFAANDADQRFTLSLYNKVDGAPGTLLGSWSNLAAGIVGSSAAATTVTGISGITLLANADYYLEASAEGTNAVFWDMNNSGATGMRYVDYQVDVPYYTQGAFSIEGTPAAATGSVPEPASWALMLGGFGMVGGAMRSRRKAAVTFA